MGKTRVRYEITTAMRSTLVERFPLAFMPKGAQKRPLKIGIDQDIAAAAPDLNPQHVRWALNDYVTGFKYLRHMKAGAERLDLSGAPNGEVSAEDAESAERALLRLASPKFMKSAQDKLRDALRPFAKYYELNDCAETGQDALEVPVSDLKRAAAVLARC